jgi:hypothetical protein
MCEALGLISSGERKEVEREKEKERDRNPLPVMPAFPCS